MGFAGCEVGDWVRVSVVVGAVEAEGDWVGLETDA